MQRERVHLIDAASALVLFALDPVSVQVGEELAITDTLDPCNILRSELIDGEYTSDNEVLYFERRENEQNTQ